MSGMDVASNPDSSRAMNLIGHVLFANMFQVLISLEYLFYNNILTSQVVADDFFRFLADKKALRVSSPRNLLQRST